MLCAFEILRRKDLDDLALLQVIGHAFAQSPITLSLSDHKVGIIGGTDTYLAYQQLASELFHVWRFSSILGTDCLLVVLLYVIDPSLIDPTRASEMGTTVSSLQD